MDLLDLHEIEIVAGEEEVQEIDSVQQGKGNSAELETVAGEGQEELQESTENLKFEDRQNESKNSDLTLGEIMDFISEYCKQSNFQLVPYAMSPQGMSSYLDDISIQHVRTCLVHSSCAYF